VALQFGMAPPSGFYWMGQDIRRAVSGKAGLTGRSQIKDRINAARSGFDTALVLRRDQSG
jgi:hypothetical protein